MHFFFFFLSMHTEYMHAYGPTHLVIMTAPARVMLSIFGVHIIISNFFFLTLTV